MHDAHAFVPAQPCASHGETQQHEHLTPLSPHYYPAQLEKLRNLGTIYLIFF
jgi:hypothetical protein